MSPDEAITEFLDAITYLDQERCMIAVRALCKQWPVITPWLKLQPALMVRMVMIFVSVPIQQRIMREYDFIIAKVAELQKRLDDPVPEFAQLNPPEQRRKE